jgi:hypothetical protein
MSGLDRSFNLWFCEATDEFRSTEYRYGVLFLTGFGFLPMCPCLLGCILETFSSLNVGCLFLL